MSRTLFIGDVHGCYDELMGLVMKIWLIPQDQLYFVWDLINKWPKSLEVVEWIRNRPNTWSVLGNHEYFPLISLEDIEKIVNESNHLSDGHREWIRTQYERSRDLRTIMEQRWHREWLISLPHIIERDNFILVHGGLHPDFGTNTPREVSTLIRLINGKPWYDSYTGTKPVIYWHWAVDGLRIRPNTIGLDSGCCFGGHLSAYCLETQEIWQVRANQISKIPEHWKNK